MLEELLDDIVSENVFHQLQSVGKQFVEDLLLFFAVGSLELALDKPRSVSMSAEFDNVVVGFLQVEASVGFVQVMGEIVVKDNTANAVTWAKLMDGAWRVEPVHMWGLRSGIHSGVEVGERHVG